MSTVRVVILWRASRDGIGHGHKVGGFRTLCGLAITSENLTHPEVSRCDTCIRLAVAEMERLPW